MFTILHPHIAAWGVREFVFNKLESEESRGRRIITCSLEFDEFDGVSGKSQDRQRGAHITVAETKEAVNPPVPVGDKERAALGEMEARYRKEKAASILDDILDAAGIRDTLITCPGVELARFSTQSIPARLCIDLLIDALKEHGIEGLTYFFDEKNVFHFGTPEDSGKNGGEAESFETGNNIIRSGSGWIEVLPRPIRHSREITVNGKPLVTVRTELTVSRVSTRLVLSLREAS